jgi:hypothetical protein
MAQVNAPTDSHRCGLCRSSEKLLRCSKCKVMSYCCIEHQSTHHSIHKAECSNIAKKIKLLNYEDEELRNFPGDSMTQEYPFINSVGHFWSIHETRDYMRARFGVVEALMKVKTFSSTQLQLQHLMDMLRLCRSDNMGVRDLVPAVMLRLNRDQECYDFVKWHCTVGQQADYDWGNMKLGYLDVKDADVFESVSYLVPQYTISLPHAASIVLLKIKLFLDFSALETSINLGKRLPSEILGNIQDHVVRSLIIANDKDTMSRTSHTETIAKLKDQINTMYNVVHKQNVFFWPALLDPDRHLNSRSEAYSHGSVAEMQLALKWCYDSWAETPGAIEFIKAKLAGKKG